MPSQQEMIGYILKMPYSFINITAIYKFPLKFEALFNRKFE